MLAQAVVDVERFEQHLPGAGEHSDVVGIQFKCFCDGLCSGGQAFDVLQSVDSAELAARLGRIAAELGLNREVYVQVNSGDDPAKFGCDLAAAPAVLEALLPHRSLKVVGLMAIAPLSDDPAVARRTFAELRRCRDGLETRFGIKLPELSMGMSGDLELAVAEGSTCVRVGSALYGARPAL